MLNLPFQPSHRVSVAIPTTYFYTLMIPISLMTLAIVRKKNMSLGHSIQKRMAKHDGFPLPKKIKRDVDRVQHLTKTVFWAIEAVVLSNRSACFLKLDLAKEARDEYLLRVWQVFVGGQDEKPPQKMQKCFKRGGRLVDLIAAPSLGL